MLKPKKPIRVDISPEEIIYLKVMSWESRKSFNEWQKKYKDDPNTFDYDVYRELISRCLCDEHGNLLMKPEDTIDQWDSDIVILLFRESSKLNKLGGEAVDEVKKN